MDIKNNPYRVLGLKNFASEEKIRKAFRQISVEYHPDRIRYYPDRKMDDSKVLEIFQKARDAYTILNNPDKKSELDSYLKRGGLESKVTADLSLYNDDTTRSCDDDYKFKLNATATANAATTFVSGLVAGYFFIESDDVGYDPVLLDTALGISVSMFGIQNLLMPNSIKEKYSKYFATDFMDHIAIGSANTLGAVFGVALGTVLKYWM